jgi:hypothetical protein
LLAGKLLFGDPRENNSITYVLSQNLNAKEMLCVSALMLWVVSDRCGKSEDKCVKMFIYEHTIIIGVLFNLLKINVNVGYIKS